MSNEKKPPSRKLEEETTNSIRQNSGRSSGENDDGDFNRAVDPPPTSTRSLMTRPDRGGHDDEEDIISPLPPARRRVTTRGQDQPWASSPALMNPKDKSARKHSKEKSLSNKKSRHTTTRDRRAASVSNLNARHKTSSTIDERKAASVSNLNAKKKASPIAPSPREEQNQEQVQDEKQQARITTSRSSTSASLKPESQDTTQSEKNNSQRRKNPSERSMEKKRVTTRASASTYIEGRNTAGTNAEAGIDNSSNSDNASQADQTLSTAPDPPSLAIRDYHALRPGAYRMSTGGVARYVNDDVDSITVDDDTDNLAETNVITAENVVPIDASLVQDELLPSPPPFRPTTSDGSSYSGHQTNHSFSIRSDGYRGNGDNQSVEHPPPQLNRFHTVGGVVSLDQTMATSATTRTRFTSPSKDPEKETSEEGWMNNQKKMFAICLGLLFIIVVACVGAVYAITGFNGDEEPIDVFGDSEDEQPKPLDPVVLPPSSPLGMEPFMYVLPNYSRDALKLEDSPQSKALRWMSEYDDPESYSVDRQLQRFALMTLLFSISNQDPGKETLLWLGGIHECNWYDSECPDGDFYTSLSLPSNKIFRGTLVPELAMLVNLERLQTHDNALVGVFPTELGDLTALKEIRMNNNLLRGTIPTEFGRLSNLETIDFSNNLLSGTIPTEIGWWDQVKYLSLDFNSLVGSIPSEIGRMNELVNMSASSNRLEGSLPSEVSRLARLKSFNVQKNYLEGEFVSRFGKSASSLETLNLHANEFFGTLPSTVGVLTKLKELDISENNLDGSLPTELGLLTNLVVLDVSANGFKNEIPTELGQLLDAKLLSMKDNFFSGIVPLEVCDLKFSVDTNITRDCDLFCLCCQEQRCE